MGCLSSKMAKAAEKVPVFSWDGQTLNARVQDVYDGDTLTAVFMWRGVRTAWKVRLLGINAPEMRPPLATAGREVVVAAATASRDYLRTLVLGRAVLIHAGPFDKYGRILARVECGGADVSGQMLTAGHAAVM